MEAAAVESLAKRMLKGKRFKGNYLEKRYAEELQSYKDIVMVSSVDEPNFSLDCSLFMDTVCNPFNWVGVSEARTENKKDFWIWTELEPDDLPFGYYRFEVKTVKTIEGNVHVKLKVLAEETENSRNYGGGDSVDNPLNISLSDFEPKKLLAATVKYLSSIEWNIPKIKQSIEFVLVSIVYLISEIPNIIRYVGIFVLALVRELNNFVHISTPIVITFLNLIQKVFGALFMIIYGLVNPRGRNPMRQQQQIKWN